jgi:hypothetical protein
MGGAIRAGTNTPRPYHKKKRAVHQAASDFGIIISHSPLETSFATPRACYLNKHKHDERVTRFITLRLLKEYPKKVFFSPTLRKPCGYKFPILDYVAHFTFREWIIPWASHRAHTLATGAHLSWRTVPGSAVGDFESFFSENSVISVAKRKIAHSFSHSLHFSK